MLSKAKEGTTTAAGIRISGNHIINTRCTAYLPHNNYHPRRHANASQLPSPIHPSFLPNLLHAMCNFT